ncbi:type I restriction-modification system subunit M [Hymenobacter lucidus]|uniref:site-specific DNA-methyltransferase (adenine-specific) n=1 Tax=Hymenobacter lucidus TaxID=2880930 RepID=A0ABS8AZ17_9BACT|nr:type I restriction-modification system subunit M [Hymenobacter lucidus]MCB2411045.1 type I restriction-modification system subunit M [Hymenobacter lucidus]
MTPEQPTTTPRVSQAEINNILWRACDTLRGTVDPTQYKDYILTLLFVKYLSDVWKDHHAAYLTKYQGDEARAARAMQLERFQVPEHCAFDYLYQQRNADNIGELINIALDDLETANRGKLTDVFRNIDFNSEPNLGQTRERNTRLKLLLQDFADPRLDLRPSVVGGEDVIGNAYEYLISRFAADAGKKGGEFYTPGEVAELLARLLNPQPGARICDPTCGSGSLLIKMARQVGSQNVSIYGQEINGSTYALCRMNMFLHGLDDAQIEWGDTLRNPRLLDGENLRRYDVVAANPPFSLDKWGHDEAGLDRHGRFYRGLPPKSKGDYAFILHMIETTLDGHGQAGVIVPHGVLFRGGTEGKIRQRLIEENLLDAVIGLPGNLFFGTGIPAAILLFRRGRITNDVLFIDASRDFDAGKNQNRLGEAHMARVVAAYRRYETEERYAQRVTPAQLLENDYSLNIPRYVDTQEAESVISLIETQQEITRLEGELAAVRDQVHTYLRELGINVEA